MTQTPLFLASKFAETLNSGNVDLFDTFIAEAYINHNPFVAPGLQGVKEFFAGWQTAFAVGRRRQHTYSNAPFKTCCWPGNRRRVPPFRTPSLSIDLLRM